MLRTRTKLPTDGQNNPVFSSPQRRTLETTQFGFKPLLDCGLRVTLVPDIEQKGNRKCDRGSEIPALKKDVPGPPRRVGKGRKMALPV